MNRVEHYIYEKTDGALEKSPIEYNYDALEIQTIIRGLAAGNSYSSEIINIISGHLCFSTDDINIILELLRSEKLFDEYTYHHSINVALYAMLIATGLELNKEDLRAVVIAGLLHDVGKTGVPHHILNKRESLAKEEYEAIKQHSLYGYNLVKPLGCFSESTNTAILLHHERMDSSGYPFGTAGCDISLSARIIAVSDVFDAMTSDRIYKRRSTPFEVFEMFLTIGSSKFDMVIVNIFRNNISKQYIGSKVLLNTGDTGEIIYISPSSIYPVIALGHECIDLNQSSNIKMLQMI